MKGNHSIRAFMFFTLSTLSACLTLCCCGQSGTTVETPPTATVSGSSTSNDSTDESSSDNAHTNESNAITSTETDQPGERDSTPTLRIGSADGAVCYGNEIVTIDASHTSEGYVAVNYKGNNPKVKLQLTGTDDITYTYNLHGGNEFFPLTSGSGTYAFGVYENIEGTTYSTLFTQSIEVTINNEYGPFLYANQYVNYENAIATIEKGCELAYSADTDLEVVENVYNYIISTFTYDYDKAATVKSGYLPVVDQVFNDNTGICFDYAAVMATMLRSQNIPTRLEVGYIDDVYHAWISTYIEDMGWINGIIEFDGSDWTLMDPTFASTSSSPKDFLASEDSYLTKYIY